MADSPSNMAGLLQQARRHHQAGELAEAEQLYRQLLQAQPEHAEANHLLGLLAYQVGRYEHAAQLISMAILADDNQAPFYNNLGLAMQAMGKGDQATMLYRQAIALDSNYAEAQNNLGIMLETIGDLAGALAAYDHAIAINPALANAHNSRGVVLQKMGRFDDAQAALLQAIALEPRFAEAHNNLANLYEAQGRIAEALATYRRVLEINPGHAGAHSNLLLCMNYDADTDAQGLFAAHCEWDARHTSGLANLPEHKNSREPQRRLRIGYVSPDFYFHPVTRFFESILENHDPQNFEIFCYSNSAWKDSVADRLKSKADNWREIFNFSDDQVFDLLKADGIDILIDLAGHTARNRLPVFALKPVPVQATYLGYPSTTGLSAIDYKISDKWLDPPGLTEQFHTEQIIRLPSGSLCFKPFENSPVIAELPGMEPEKVTFASFNNTAKVNNQVITLWSKVLRSLPESRMLLVSKSLDDPGTIERLIAMFSEQGIHSNRLSFAGWMPIEQHLELYNKVHVGLDTFPWCGNTTTCDALWMGVPVITMDRPESRSRMGLDVLRQAGLERFIASTDEEFVALAQSLASDETALQMFRAEVRRNMSASNLMNGSAVTRSLETAYREMWTRWCSGNS